MLRNSVHPIGGPISHSTHSGVSWPPLEANITWSILSVVRLVLGFCFSAAFDDPLDLLATGGGQILCADIKLDDYSWSSEGCLPFDCLPPLALATNQMHSR